ncbi:MAG: hypothetical protein MJB14_19765 [Spirochaetes bacterium]|nr:hypothetical protein [Spirochaetota bacterium]
MFKIPRKRKLGVYILAIGIIIFLKIVFYQQFPVLNLMLFFVLFASIDLIVYSFSRKKKTNHFFIPGATLSLSALFLIFYIYFFEKNNYSLEQLWPILGIFPGISLILYYIFFTPRSRSTIVPGFFITMLSVVFLLVRLDIINLDLQKFLLLLIPIFLIIIGLYLIFDDKIRLIQEQIDQTLEDHKKSGD